MDITGSPFITDARLALTAHLSEIAPVYYGHATANLALNTFTLGIESALPVSLGGPPAVQNWEITFSIRAHTAYVGGAYLEDDTLALLVSASNKLFANLQLGSGCRIPRIGEMINNQEFKESATIGGQLICEVDIAVVYTQE